MNTMKSVLIGCPSGQDGPILPARNCPLGIARFETAQEKKCV